jgi:hypothetical protein
MHGIIGPAERADTLRPCVRRGRTRWRVRHAPIGEYGIIGDLYTVALVGMDESIDFLFLPDFDSPSVLAALVGAERGGRFQIVPVLDGAARKRAAASGPRSAGRRSRSSPGTP